MLLWLFNVFIFSSIYSHIIIVFSFCNAHLRTKCDSVVTYALWLQRQICSRVNISAYSSSPQLHHSSKLYTLVLLVLRISTCSNCFEMLAMSWMVSGLIIYASYVHCIQDCLAGQSHTPRKHRTVSYERWILQICRELGEWFSWISCRTFIVHLCLHVQLFISFVNSFHDVIGQCDMSGKHKFKYEHACFWQHFF